MCIRDSIKSGSDGIRAGVKTVLGLTCGLLFHTLLLVFGISAVIEASPFVFFLIKLFGCSYFLFLAIELYFSKNNRETKKRIFQNDFLTGLMMNLLNPKVTIFFIAFFPNYIFDDTMSIQIQFAILGIIFWTVANLIFLVVVYISSRFNKIIQKFIGSKKVKLIKFVFYLFISVWIIL